MKDGRSEREVPAGAAVLAAAVRPAVTRTLPDPGDLAAVAAARAAALDTLVGVNPRTVSEQATRARLSDAQADLLLRLLDLAADTPVAQWPEQIGEALEGGATAVQRADLAAMCGLPAKTVDNLANRPGDSKDAVVAAYAHTTAAAHAAAAATVSEASPTLQLLVGGRAVADPALLLMWFAGAVGAETLRRRGSDKSGNGKTSERAALGLALRLCGFTQVRPDDSSAGTAGVFWLSSSDDGREADATVIVSADRAVRIDIGLIGAGNPEVTADKMTRYRARAELLGAERDVDTVVIVDRVPDGSVAAATAAEVGAALLQMSDPDWLAGLFAAVRAHAGVPAVLDVPALWAAHPDPAVRRALLDAHATLPACADVFRLAAPKPR